MRLIALHTTVLWMLLFTAACKPQESLQTSNLLQGKILRIGHGGAGFDTFRNPFPANTIRSIRQGIFAEGADGVEFDVQMSADGVVVLFHDDGLSEKTNCSGCIHAQSFEEIKDCHHHGRISGTHERMTVPRLDSALAVIAAAGRPIHTFVNVKLHTPCDPGDDGSYYQRFAQSIAASIRLYGLEGQCYVEALDVRFLLKVREADSLLQLIFDDEDFDRGMATVREHDFLGLAISNERVTAAQVEQAHDEGRWLGIWGVKILPGTKQAVAKGPEFIMTDDLRMLRNVLGE